MGTLGVLLLAALMLASTLALAFAIVIGKISAYALAANGLAGNFEFRVYLRNVLAFCDGGPN